MQQRKEMIPMTEREVRLDLNDLELMLRKQGTIEANEFLNDVHIEPGELVLRVLKEEVN